MPLSSVRPVAISCRLKNQVNSPCIYVLVLSSRLIVFSWRTTLSAHLFNNSPRLSLPTLPSELVFTLLTYGFALFNLARLNVVALGTYERERGISDVERKAKDEKLGFAVTLFCRAGGLFEHVGTTVLSGAEQIPGLQSGRSRPPELSKEVSMALSKCAPSLCLTVIVRGSFLATFFFWTDLPLLQRNRSRSAN